MRLYRTLRETVVTVRLRSLVLIAVVALGLGVEPALGQGLWSSGDRNASMESVGWVNVRKFISSQTTPALAAGNEIHLVDLAKGGVLVRDFVWTEADGWKDPTFLGVPGGPASGAGPGLAYRGNGIFDLVVRGKDQYYHAYLTSGASWSGWEPIGGWGGDPTVTTTIINGNTAVDVWVQAQGSIWRCRWTSPKWQAWENLGNPAGIKLATAPGVVVRPGGTIDVVAGAESDGQLYHIYFSPEGKPSAWETIPGRTLSKPGLTSSAATRLDVWVRGASDKRLYHSVFDATANPAGWSDFEMSINDTTGTGLLGTLIGTGPSVVLSHGVTTVAAVGIDDKLLVRSWAETIPAGLTAMPSVRISSTLATTSAENSVVVVPPAGGSQPNAKIINTGSSIDADLPNGSIIYSIGVSSELWRVGYACTINGVGIQASGPGGICPATMVTNITPKTGSTDTQIVRLFDGKLVWLAQNGSVTLPVVNGCKGGRILRGTESIRLSADRGKTWSLAATLDPCAGGLFDTSVTCNTLAVEDNSCWPDPKTSPQTGMDRPELLASTFDNSVYMTVGIAGTPGSTANYLHILRSNGSSLGIWEDLATGLQSGGALVMAETSTSIYFARAEYGFPSNVGLYRLAKNAAFKASNFLFVGNLATQDAAGDVQLALTTNASGDLVVIWAYATQQGDIRRGFSRPTPGGMVTLAVDTYRPKLRDRVALPTLVASPTIAARVFLYWYEGYVNETYSVKGAMSDGIGRWSEPVTLGGSWPGSPTFTAMGQPGNDYLKGYYLSGQNTFLATWLQPDAGGATTRLGQAAVK